MSKAFIDMSGLCCELMDVLEDFGCENVKHYRKAHREIEKDYMKESK